VTGTSFDPITRNDVQTVVYEYVDNVEEPYMQELADFTWRHTGMGGASTEVATSLFVDGNNIATVNLYVSGYTTAFTGTQDSLVLGHYWNGSERVQWDDHQDGTGNGSDQARKLLVTVDGNGVARVVVTGFSWGGATDYDSWTLSYPRDGNPLQIRRWRSPYAGDDRAEDMVATNWIFVSDKGGHIYILGRAWNGSNYDYRMVKLDSAGADGTFPIVWDGGIAPAGYAPYDAGLGPDLPAAIRLNLDAVLDDDFPDLWVTGRSTAIFDEAPKYATIHYTQAP
jgi:hypothetical protein